MMVLSYFPLKNIINLSKWREDGKHYPSARTALLQWVDPVYCLDIVPSESFSDFYQSILMYGCLLNMQRNGKYYIHNYNQNNWK